MNNDEGGPNDPVHNGWNPPSAKLDGLRETLNHLILTSDGRFQLFCGALAFSAVAIFAWVVGYLIEGAFPVLDSMGYKFFTGSTWSFDQGIFGALPFIGGTLYTSAVAMMIAVPISVGIAIFISEIAPKWIGTPLGFLVEMLAAVPSVVFGIWGIFTLRGFMRDQVEPFLQGSLGFLPFFEGRTFGIDKLSAAVILAIMIIPTISAISRDALKAVPTSQKEAALALGATRYEMVGTIALSYARSGIFGAAVLGLGRAVGETMAVTMVIGNVNSFSWSLLDPGQTLSSLIAANWWEAPSGTVQQSALIGVGLVLFVLMLAINVVGRILLSRVTKVGRVRVE
ncbi:MAG: phosphate ABC transporter permease subunit PstC [Candidatus Thermoplasmatota archaeon]|nr:phosphate ABC transporter permease subunit PstC [Candidatus Thermoplasmatota archaeon]